MTARLLLLWVGFAFSREADIQKRVVGGRQCQPNERLYHVRLSGLDPDGTWSFCGGSLLTDRWILTASHCWQPGRVEIISEPRIYRDNNDNVHDIMLLKLPYPTNIPRVAYPDCDYSLQLKDTVNVAGHGSTTAGISNMRRLGQAPSLHCGDLHVVDCANLLTYLRNTDVQTWNYLQYQSLFCGHSSTVDVCWGDSGGGVMFNNMIYGLISTGNPTVACVDGGGFINLCQPEYKRWIQQNINNP
ncbi:hypothetical protein Q5P01_025606 [Channa striata]|uniref:Peptidase S1 domain-containing protein n=1 Tax=Channa striata TaxID=64152 RepID=A0AA88INR4_CHASR|nr:hypothetical protein Q5P01_025606 [Channa striata]